MISESDDVELVVNVVQVLIEGKWYILEIAVLPDGVVHSIVQVGRGERA